MKKNNNIRYYRLSGLTLRRHTRMDQANLIYWSA